MHLICSDRTTTTATTTTTKLRQSLFELTEFPFMITNEQLVLIVCDRSLKQTLVGSILFVSAV